VADHLLRLWGLACLLPRWQVKRLYRLKEYERSLAEEALDKKNHRLDHVIGSKKQSIVERKKRAQDFVVKKQLLKEEAAKTMRSASAPPGGVQLTAAAAGTRQPDGATQEIVGGVRAGAALWPSELHRRGILKETRRERLCRA
jgi:hypothetical protein